MTIEEEQNLVEEARKDVQAFGQLYEYYFPRIFSYCLNRMVDKEAAEDVTSQVFISAVDKLKKYKSRKGVRFSSWLYRIAHNKIIDYIKKNKRLMSIEATEIEFSKKEELNASVQNVFNQKKIAVVLGTLKERYQKIISLKYYSELSNPEIAEVMNMKPSQVAVVLHRAVNSFRKKCVGLYPKLEDEFL